MVKKLVFSVFCFTIAPSILWSQVKTTLEIHILNLGQADSQLVIATDEYEDGTEVAKTLMIDAGQEFNPRKNTPNTRPIIKGAEKIRDYVSQVYGETNIDYLVITHYHYDHIGSAKEKNGLFKILEKGYLSFGLIYDRGFKGYGENPAPRQQYIALAKNEMGEEPIRRKKLKRWLKTYKSSPPIQLGENVVVEVVAVNGNKHLPKKTKKISENDYSIALKITLGNFEYFTGGDLSGESENSYHDIESFIKEDVGNIEVYRVNHHGSRHSTSSVFYTALQPEVDVISCGNGNSYGHPHPETLERLSQGNDDIYLTESGYLYKYEGLKDNPHIFIKGDIIIRVSENGALYTVNGNSYSSYSDAEEAHHLDNP